MNSRQDEHDANQTRFQHLCAVLVLTARVFDPIQQHPEVIELPPDIAVYFNSRSPSVLIGTHYQCSCLSPVDAKHIGANSRQ